MAKSIGLSGLITERDLSEEIAKVAYKLYEERGKGSGSDLDDWLEAEEIVMDRYEKLKKNEIGLMEEAAKEVVERKRGRRKSVSL